MATFKDRIKELRIQHDLSQQNLADKVKLNKQTISQYERGVREPDYEILEVLCDFFNVSTDFMLGRSDVTGRLLSLEEIEIIDAYNKLTIEQKVLVKNMLNLSSLKETKDRLA